MEVLYRMCHIPQKKVGQLVGGIDYSAVSQARKRLQLRMKADKNIKTQFEDIMQKKSISQHPHGGCIRIQ